VRQIRDFLPYLGMAAVMAGLTYFAGTFFRMDNAFVALPLKMAFCIGIYALLCVWFKPSAYREVYAAIQSKRGTAQVSHQNGD